MRYSLKLVCLEMELSVARTPAPKNDAKHGDPVRLSSGPLAIRNRTDRVLALLNRRGQS